MTTRLMVPAGAMVALFLAGCETPQPAARGVAAPLRQQAVSPAAAFAAAERVLEEHFVIRTRDAPGGYLRTAPVESRAPQASGRMSDPLAAPRRIRKFAEVQIERSGDGVNIWCTVRVEQYETEAHGLFAQEHSLSDLPSDMPPDRDGATTAEQNAVWRSRGRDERLERQIRREIQELLAQPPPE